jgi:hypothetical protein
MADEDNPSKLSKREIVAWRERERENDHWRWVWKSLKRWGILTAAAATGAHALIVAWRDLIAWLHQK